jgi:hypothetical protein
MEAHTLYAELLLQGRLATASFDDAIGLRTYREEVASSLQRSQHIDAVAFAVDHEPSTRLRRELLEKPRNRTCGVEPTLRFSLRNASLLVVLASLRCRARPPRLTHDADRRAVGFQRVSVDGMQPCRRSMTRADTAKSFAAESIGNSQTRTVHRHEDIWKICRYARTCPERRFANTVRLNPRIL